MAYYYIKQLEKFPHQTAVPILVRVRNSSKNNKYLLMINERDNQQQCRS